MNARQIIFLLTVIFLLTFTSLPYSGLKPVYAEDPPPPIRCAVIFPFFYRDTTCNTRFSVAGDSSSLGNEKPRVELFYYNPSGEMIPVEISAQWSEKNGTSENSQWTWFLSEHTGAPSMGFLVVLTNIPYVEAACFVGDLSTGATCDAPAIIDYSITGIDENGHIVRNAAYTPPQDWDTLDPAEDEIDPTLHHTTLVFPYVFYVSGENGFDTGISITNTFDATDVEGRTVTFYLYNSDGDLCGDPVTTEDLEGDDVSEMSTVLLSQLIALDTENEFTGTGTGSGCLVAHVNIPFAQGYSVLNYGETHFHAAAGAKVDNNIYNFTDGIPQRLIEPESDHTSIVVPFVMNTEGYWTGVSVVNTVPVGDEVDAHFYLYDMSGNFVEDWTSTMGAGDELNGMLLALFNGSDIVVNGTTVYDELGDDFYGWLLIIVESPGAEGMLVMGDDYFNFLSMTRADVDNNIIGVDGGEIQFDENAPPADAGDSWSIPFVVTVSGQPPWDTRAITVNTRNRSEWQGTSAQFTYQGWTEAGAELESWTDTANGSGALFPSRVQSVTEIQQHETGYYPLVGRLRVETNTSCAHGLAAYFGTDWIIVSEAEIGLLATPPGLDLDIDSDNNNGNDLPSRSPLEDIIEEDSPGKYIGVNDGDADNDGIPGFADGFNLDGTNGNDDDAESIYAAFTPLVVELSSYIDVAKAKIRITYEASDPASVTRDGTDPYFTYTPSSGKLRIWTKDANAFRKKASIAAPVPGDYVPAGTFDASVLGFAADNRVVILYVEGVGPSDSLGGSRILVEVDPDDEEPQGFTISDSVRATSIAVDIDVDGDNNNDVGAPDRNLVEDQWEYFWKLDGTWTGKVMLVDDGDVNHNFVPDYADFGAVSGNKFTPLVLELPAPIDLTKAKICISYYCSEPDDVDIDDGTPHETEYTPGLGLARIWTKNADQARNKASIGAPAPGDFVRDYSPIDENLYTPAQLGFAGEARQVTLYIEGVNPSNCGADTEIVMLVDPDGNGPAGYVTLDALRVTVMKIDLDAANSIEATEEAPGTGVLLNDDWDGQMKYTATGGGHRELEPIWDLDYTGGEVAAEDDLMKLALRFYPDTLNGNVTLKIAAGATVRLWPRATKGPAGDIITIPGAGQQYPISALPAEIYVEGIQQGRTEFTLEYTVGTKTYMEKDNIDVVTLHESQGGVRKVINEYNVNIAFAVNPNMDTVPPAPPSYAYLWDLDGDGNRKNGAWEDGTIRTATVKYCAEASGAGKVNLPRDAEHRRQTYDICVKLKGGELKGGLVMTKTIRVALDSFEGTALAGGNSAARDAEVAGIFDGIPCPAWNNNSPITFDNTDIPGNATQAGIDAEYGDAANGYNLRILNNNHRILYSNIIPGNGLENGAGTGAGIRIYCCFLGANIWDSGQTLEDLIASANHEKKHCEQDNQAKNGQSGNVYNLLDVMYGGVVSAGYMSFAEAEAHLTELEDANVGWLHAAPGPQNDLSQFRSRFYAECVQDLYPQMAAGATKNAARAFLQDLYERVPFLEMKRSDYNAYFVRPPE